MKETSGKKEFVLSEKNKNIIILSVSLLAVLLMLPLALTKNLAYDPAYSVAMVRHSFKEIITLCSYDVHSPLYYFIAKIFYHVFLNHIFGLKICSLAFFAFYIWILAFPFRKEFGFKMSLTMIVLSTFFPTFLTHNTEARMYSMAVASFTAVAFLGYRIIKEFKIKYAILFLIASVFSVYIHTYTMLSTVLVYLVMAVFIIIGKENRKKKIVWFLINALIVSISYLPWLFSLVSQFGDKAEGALGEYDAAYYINDIILEFFSSNMYPKKYQVIIWFIIVLFSAVVVLVKKSPYIKEIIIGFSMIVIIAAVGIYLSVNNSPCFMGRYLNCMAPFVLFLIAAAIDKIDSKIIVGLILLFGFLGGVLVYRDRFHIEYEGGIDGYIEYAKEHFEEDDALIYADIHNNLLSVYYSDVYSFIYGRKDDFNPYKTDEVFTDMEQLQRIKGNVYLVCFDNKNPGWFLECDYEQVYGFHFMYYNFSLYRIYNF